MLADLLRVDKSIQEDKLPEFLSYAEMFDKNLQVNLYKSSLELDSDNHTNDPSSWLRFLRQPTVKKYIENFRRERAETLAQSVLQGIEKPSDALRFKKSLEDGENEEDKTDFIVMFLPQKDYGF